jgi:hypothetical protein
MGDRLADHPNPLIAGLRAAFLHGLDHQQPLIAATRRSLRLAPFPALLRCE